MSSGKRLAGLLLLTTALSVPSIVAAQDTQETPDPLADAVAANQEEEEQAEQPEISIPGGGNSIIVTGRRRTAVQRSSSQVVSVLSSEQIARTGEGDIAGALNRVTGLSTVGNGLVFVRGLGDRYSLALLNGLPLPSPQPLSRVVPLDIFPTSVVASSLVQKTYSANFPGEFGGGVINLTTRAIPDESFLKISGGVSGDTVTTLSDGLTYFGSDTDWTGFDDGRRDIRPALQNFLDSGARISDAGVDTQGILLELGDPNLVLVQRNRDIPANFSGSVTAGTSVDFGETGRFGVIATASLSNKWRTRAITSQTAVNADLDLDTDFLETVTDQRILANALLGFGLEIGDHQFRITNLFIRDSLKRAAIELGTDFQDEDTELSQSTAWFERQLFNTQFVGELEFGDLSVDLRAGYAQTQREAPFEWDFSYVATNNANDPTGELFLNTLDPQRGGAIVSFSDLEEDLYYGGIDLSYTFNDWLSATVGYAYTDTKRVSSRREFDIRASTGFPDIFGSFRPDLLFGDAIINLGFDPEAQAAAGVGPFEFDIFETTQADPAFVAALEVQAAYGLLRLNPFDTITVDVGVRYEDATQSVTPLEVFETPTNSGSATFLDNDYFLPSATVTWEASDRLQFRASASRTIARPQFRELIFQTYFDPETNRQFNGNPSLIDSELLNFEVRGEYYIGSQGRVSLAGFYKDIDNPIEVFSSFSDNDQINGFANAPSATLFGAELEAQYNFDLFDLGGWFETKELVVVSNYTFTNSELKVSDSDIARVFPFADQPATNFFRDGVPLTGQSDHLVNFQLGLEDTDKLQQITMLVNYASERVTSRGTAALPDIVEDPGLRLDLVARQGFTLGGTEMELKAEARNILGRDNFEFQSNGTNRIEINSYQVGTSFSLSLSAEF
ncbi:TonB-dependent receptor domain-containing protein [Erythrobacter sp. W53]|uniref:TonB-dependent receptor domain-containing protein n=1 Tax=Erythrobacter sp. W53 TaxID=3425947 RepID=UPI003D768457